MRVIKKARLVVFLLAAMLLAHNAAGAIYLPESSYAVAQGAWQGSLVYDEAGFDVLVEFAVYDSQNLQNQAEIDLVEQLDLPGQYVYAYQIFNTNNEGYEDVAYFAVFNPDETPMTVDEQSIGSQDDENGGFEPSAAYFTGTNSRAMWKFDDGDNGYLTQSEHSYFLVFSSTSAPVAGDYELKIPDEDTPVPGDIPEPTVVVLLGLGSAALFARGKRKD